jgi:hypothetical protein
MADKHLHTVAMNLVDCGKALGMEGPHEEALAAALGIEPDQIILLVSKNLPTAA